MGRRSPPPVHPPSLLQQTRWVYTRRVWMRGLQSCVSPSALPYVPLLVPPSFLPLPGAGSRLGWFTSWHGCTRNLLNPHEGRSGASLQKNTRFAANPIQDETADARLHTGGTRVWKLQQGWDGEGQSCVGKPWEGWREFTWSHSCASASSLPALPAHSPPLTQ